MIAKQCIFVDREKTVHAGIYCMEEGVKNSKAEYIICLCCGGIVDPRKVVFKYFQIFSKKISIDKVCSYNS